MPQYHLMIVDDHPLFRGALRQTLEGSLGDIRITEGGSLDDLTAALESGEDIDLVLLDLAMPGAHGVSGLVYLKAQAPHLPVVVVSGNENPAVIRRCFEFGAAGFIPKTMAVEQIRNAVKTVLEGKIWLPPEMKLDDMQAPDDLAAKLATLTPQQVKVLMMLGEGLLNKQIAFQLKVSEATVKAHVSAILHKLGVDSRTQAVIAVNKLEGFEPLDQQKLP